MGPYEVVEDTIRLAAEVESVRQQMLEVPPNATFRVAERRSLGVEARRLVDGPVHECLVKVYKRDPGMLGSHLPGGFRVSRANFGLSCRGGVSIGSVEHCHADLVQGRRCDEEDLGLVRRDDGMVDNAGQVLLVLVERNTLEVGGQRDACVVGAEEDELAASGQWFRFGILRVS